MSATLAGLLCASVTATLALAGCATSSEQAARSSLAGSTRGESRARGAASPEVGTDGSTERSAGRAAHTSGPASAGPRASSEALATDTRSAAAISVATDDPAEAHRPEEYVATALRNHPGLEADYDRWRAGVLSITRARRLPDPVIGYALFVRQVQTRVGPQRQRLSITQSFPWPTQLRAGADAAAFRARALERRFDARVLQVRATVEERYWRLWYVRQVAGVRAELLTLLDQMAELVRARVESGGATLGDLLQVDVSRARLRDTLEGLREQERAASAELLQAIGARPGTPTPTAAQAPVVALPRDGTDALREAIADHPDLRMFDELAASHEADARRATAEGLPMLQVGLDWIETGPAMNPVSGSGQDAVILRVGASVPLQRQSYRDARDAASASAEAARGDRRAAEDVAVAQLEGALSAVRDSYRRVRLHRDTLVPQALSAYEAVLGAYQAGRGNVAANLLAQRDLLELREAIAEAEALHARAWARLDAIVGREVSRVSEDALPDAAPDAAGHDAGAAHE